MRARWVIQRAKVGSTSTVASAGVRQRISALATGCCQASASLDAIPAPHLKVALVNWSNRENTADGVNDSACGQRDDRELIAKRVSPLTSVRAARRPPLHGTRTPRPFQSAACTRS